MIKDNSFYWEYSTDTLNIILPGVLPLNSCFVRVVAIGLDCVLVEDLERNDGSPEKPYYMAKGLRNVLGKKNKKPKGKDGDSTEVMKEESM
jgi:hypothetical protein